jgi:hypothetical protein
VPIIEGRLYPHFVQITRGMINKIFLVPLKMGLAAS